MTVSPQNGGTPEDDEGSWPAEDVVEGVVEDVVEEEDPWSGGSVEEPEVVSVETSEVVDAADEEVPRPSSSDPDSLGLKHPTRTSGQVHVCVRMNRD